MSMHGCVSSRALACLHVNAAGIWRYALVIYLGALKVHVLHHVPLVVGSLLQYTPNSSSMQRGAC